MISYIGCLASDFTAGFGMQLRDGLVNGALLPSADGDLRSFLEQHLGDGATDSASRAGNEADFVGHIFSRIRSPASARVDFEWLSSTKSSGLSLRPRRCSS